MQWTPEQETHVLHILCSVTDPRSDLQAYAMLEVDRLSANPIFPHLLAHFLAYGTTSSIQQTAGVLLKGLIASMNKSTQTSIQSPRSLEIPLLIALCHIDNHVRTTAGCCIAALLRTFPSGVCSEDPNQQPWASGLINALKQLVASVGFEDGKDGRNKYLGVSTCIGLLFEDDIISALYGTALTKDSVSMARDIFHLIIDMIHNIPYLDVKLDVLNTTHKITFNGAMTVSDFFDSDDSDFENSSDLLIEGQKTNNLVENPLEDKEERKNLSEALKDIEQTFVVNLLSDIPEILHNITISSNGDQVLLAKGYTCVLGALFPMIVYWDSIKGPVTQHIIPTVIQWMADFNIYQNTESQTPTRHQTIQILLEKCVEFITEVAQQIDCPLAMECIYLHRVEILERIFSLSYLDYMALTEISVGRDIDHPDNESEVIFTRRLRGEDRNAEQETQFDESAFDGNNENEEVSSLRFQVNWCLSNLSTAISEDEIRGVASGFLEPLVHELLVDLKTTSTTHKWIQLEASLAFLGEVWAETMEFNADDISQIHSITGIINIAMTIIDIRQGQGHPIAPVRSAAIRLIKKLACALMSLSSDNDETLADNELQLYGQCSQLVNESISLFIQITKMDENKSVICTAIDAISHLIQHSFICNSREEENEDSVDTDEQYECKISVSRTHITTFYGLVGLLSSFQLRPRVALYKAFSSIIPKDFAESNSIFVPLSEEFMLSLLEKWRTLSFVRYPIHIPDTVFHPVWLATHESIVIGDLVCTTIDSFEDHDIKCPSTVIHSIWHGICSPMLEMRSTDGCLNLCHQELEALELAIDLASACCSTCDTQVALQLFQTTSLVDHVAHVTKSIIAQTLPQCEYTQVHVIPDIVNNILGGGYGLLGGFCSAADKEMVLMVVDELISMVLATIRHETRQEHVKLLEKTVQCPTSSNATSNAFWCFSQLLRKILPPNGNPIDYSASELLINVSKNSFSPGVPEALCKDLIFLTQRNEQDRTNNNFSINLLFVTIKMAELFPDTFFIPSEGSELPLMLMIRALSHIAPKVEDTTEMIEVSLSLGKLLHLGLKHQVYYDVNIKKQLVDIAGYTATSIKKSQKSKNNHLSALGIACQAVWTPIVKACHDVVFPRGKVKDRRKDFRSIFS